jgi:hypothetical protein
MCVSRTQSEFFSFESEFFGRGLKQARTKGTFWQRCTLNFFGDRTNYKAKDIIEKITNLFCIYLFPINTFINTYTGVPELPHDILIAYSGMKKCRGSYSVYAASDFRSPIIRPLLIAFLGKLITLFHFHGFS